MSSGAGISIKGKRKTPARASGLWEVALPDEPIDAISMKSCKNYARNPVIFSYGVSHISLRRSGRIIKLRPLQTRGLEAWKQRERLLDQRRLAAAQRLSVDTLYRNYLDDAGHLAGAGGDQDWQRIRQETPQLADLQLSPLLNPGQWPSMHRTGNGH